MAILIHPRLWRSQQPPPGAEINFSHPLAQGLTGYYLPHDAGIPKLVLPPNLPGTLVGTGVPATPPIKAGPGGKTENWNGAFAHFYERGVWCEPNWVTVLGGVRRTGTVVANTGPFIKTFNDNVGPPYISISPIYNSGGAGQDIINASFGYGGTNHNGTDVNLGTGFTLNPHTFGMSVGPSGTSAVSKLWVNGRQRSADSFASIPGIAYDSSSKGRMILAGSNAATGTNGGNLWVGELYWFGLWNRALDPSVIEWLHAEPYAMFVPMIRRTYKTPTPPPVVAAGQPNVCVATF